jgi:hypothetical protein
LLPGPVDPEWLPVPLVDPDWPLPRVLSVELPRVASEPKDELLPDVPLPYADPLVPGDDPIPECDDVLPPYDDPVLEPEPP